MEPQTLRLYIVPLVLKYVKSGLCGRMKLIFVLQSHSKRRGEKGKVA